MKNSTTPKQWRFFRAGGFDQVKLETGADLLAIDQLDLKLWVALACPVSGVEFDKTTLDLIDTDKDGRVRAPELVSAVKWAGRLLKNSDDLIKGASSLPVSAINTSDPEGAAVVTFCRQVLGKGDADSISLEDAAQATQTLASKPFNGDGIVTADAASDEESKTLINDIISCFGADTDASGKPGVSQPKVDQFFSAATSYSDWWKQAEGNQQVLPLGEPTAAAAAAVASVRVKVEDYFARCQLASFDPRALVGLNREEKEFVALGTKELTTTAPEISSFPLAHVEPGKSLPLDGGINPAWAGAISAFRKSAVEPLLGDKTSLNLAEWNLVLSKLAPYEAWSSTKTGTVVEKLGLARVRAILAGKGKSALTALIAKDNVEQANARAVGILNRLVRYHRDLMQLCLNFVSFRDFYSRKKPAIFQAGTLYLDQRSCDLCLRVDDPAKHAAMAGLAGTYLAYCDCFRKGTNEKMQIVAAFTAGDSDNLMVGRNGIFFDTLGRDWDATITKIVDNPISIRQAFFSPYKKLVRMIEEQVAKRAAAADAAADAKLATAAKTVVAGEPIPVKPAEPPRKIDTGTLAAIGLVLTTLLAALGGIFGKIAGLAWWQIPLAILAIIVAISLPSVIMAYLKLRRRNLGPILDANGWAVNARAKLNVPFGGALTKIAVLPPGSSRDLVDPFAEKRRPWGAYITVLVLILLGLSWYWGRLDRMLPGKAKSTSVLGTNAPAYKLPQMQTLTVTNVPAEPVVAP